MLLTNLSSKTKLSTFLVLLFVLPFTADMTAQTDTLQPSDIIKPYDIPDSVTVFCSFHHAIPIGDINGDGWTDFTFRGYGSTLLVTDRQHPTQASSVQADQLSGIGDFNGDGFDDMLSEANWNVYFGNAAADNLDTLHLSLENMDNYHLEGVVDINGDGKSEIICQLYDIANLRLRLYVISYEGTTFKFTPVDFTIWVTPPPKMLCHVYDYDNDGVDELLLVTEDFGNKNKGEKDLSRYKYGWFVYDSTTDTYVSEAVEHIDFVHAPISSFTSALSDINGDGLEDICHDFYDPETGFQLEVYFGTTEAPYYFDDPVTITTNNSNRLFYPAGDVNNDGADDWYSKYGADTVVVYYGRQDIQEQGAFTKTYYPVNGSGFFMPPSAYGNYTLTEQHEITDYNNDGIPDLLFDYWSFDENGRYDLIGTAYVFGGEELDFDNPAILGVRGKEIYYSGFGKILKNTGDLNNDGYDDWAILAPGGIVNIYYGSNPLDFTPDLTVMLPQYPSVSSYDMAFGDMNGDGIREIVISNSSSSSVNFNRGLFKTVQHIYVFPGGQSRYDTLYATDAMKIWDLYDENNTFNLPVGQSLAITGDYNADGFNDLVAKSSASRKALIFYGGVELSDTYDDMITVYHSGFSSQFAIPVAACGDVNGDGYDDFTLGDGSEVGGQSLVYFGGPEADNQYDVVLENTASDPHFFGSQTPKTAGDFNDDGQSDIIQWNPSSDSMLVYFGGTDFDNQPDIILTDSNLRGSIYCIEYINDFSKKGRADILVPGWINDKMMFFLFYGCNEDKQQADFYFSNALGYPGSVASGDFDKNGYIDVFTGHPGAMVDAKFSGGLVQHYISPTLTSIGETKEAGENKLILMPNPATSSVQVLFRTPATEDIFISISDVNGTIRAEKRSISNHPDAMDISTLPTGIYFVKITSGKTSVTGKLIKR